MNCPIDIINYNEHAQMRVFSLYYYYPMSAKMELTESQEEIRQLIWDFKDGKSAEYVATKVGRAIKRFIPVRERPNYTLFFVPAATSLRNKNRYEQFSEMLAHKCRMTNGYGSVSVLQPRATRHSGGAHSFDNLSFDSVFLKDRKIILFDDILTRGDTMGEIKKILENLGAKVICGFTLGQSTHIMHIDEPFDLLIENTRRGNNRLRIPSSRITSKMYNEGKSVPQIAEERSLSEITVYLHLFKEGIIDLHEYVETIPRKKLDRAHEIYRTGEYEILQSALDFLSTQEIAAFYSLNKSNI